MNKVDLIKAVSEKTGLPEPPVRKSDREEDVVYADAAVTAVFDCIKEALAEGDKVQITGVGTFDVSERAAREGRNPRTGETMQIEASRTPRFKASKVWKDSIK